MMFFVFGAFFLVLLVVMMLLFGVVLIAPVLLAILGGVAISALFGGPSLGTTALVALVLYLVFRRRPGRRRGRRRRDHEVEAVATRAPAPAAKRATSGEPLLDDSFAALAEHADWARSRIAVVEESCRLFLRLAGLQPFDSEAGDLAVRIRKRVPEHVGASLEACEAATASERRVILDETVFTLEKVGAEADRQRARLMAPTAQAMDVQRRHLTRRDEPGPFTAE